jgi:glutamine synthetase type III
MEEEFELVPINPLRKLETRIDKLESSGLNSSLVKELIEISRTNQSVIEDLTKLNSEMITKVSELTVSVNNAIDKIENFIERIELTPEAKEEPRIETKSKVPDERLEKLEKRINALALYIMPRAPREPPANVQKRLPNR